MKTWSELTESQKEEKREYRRRWRLRNPDKNLASSRRQGVRLKNRRRDYPEEEKKRDAIARARNPKGRADTQRKIRYGLTNEKYDDMFCKQKGKCAICKQDSPLSVDHCHTTKKVRGLLCGSCNNGLGRFRDSPKFLFSAAAYLIR